jgi:hypothetical protein
VPAGQSESSSLGCHLRKVPFILDKHVPERISIVCVEMKNSVLADTGDPDESKAKKRKKDN